MIKAITETDQEYLERTSRIDMDDIHSTLQECGNGIIDKHLIDEAIMLVEKYRDEILPSLIYKNGYDPFL